MKLSPPGPRTIVVTAALVVVGVIAYVDGHSDLFFLDTPYFLHMSRLLFSHEWANIYADPQLQAGPLHVLAYGIIDRAAFFLDVHPSLVAAIAIEVGFAAAVTAVARVVRPFKELWWVDVALIAALVALGMTWNAFATGHFSEGIIPLLWIISTRAALDNKPIRAGLIVALATGLMSWGIFGLITLLMVPGWRGILRSGVAAVLGTAALYGPFFLWGTVNTFSWVWFVRRDAGVIAPFVTLGESFGWGARLVQGLFVAMIGCLGAWWLKKPRTAHACWALPLAMILARVWTDPVGFEYYWLPVQVVALIGIVAVLRLKLEAWRFVVLAGLYLLLLPSATWAAPIGIAVCALSARLDANEPSNDGVT